MKTRVPLAPKTLQTSGGRYDARSSTRSEPALAGIGETEVAQREGIESVTNSPRVQQSAALVDLIRSSPRVVAQRRHLNSLFGDPVQQQNPSAPRVNRTGLPDQLKSGVESLSGISMDGVKVHYNSDKPVQLNAHAYAQGSDIHLAPGQEQHLSHEAWHVVQQKQGRVKPTMQMKAGVAVNADAALEAEADAMGSKALAVSEGVSVKAAGYPQHLPALPNIAQLKITDSAIKLDIVNHFKGRNVDPVALKLFIDDAFETTDTFDDAVKRIENGLLHHDAMFGVPGKEALQIEAPQVKASSTRPKINIDADRERPKHKSSVLDTDLDEDKILEEWASLNTVKFYAKTRENLKAARDPDHNDHATAKGRLDSLILAYDKSPKVKKRIDGYVRVKAQKAKGASSGTGLDELFKTSETMKYLELSYRPPKEMSAVAEFNGEEFDWMDAQQQIRLSTELIVWAGDLVGEISGHTGTFQKEHLGKWMTAKQSLMHEVRDDAISSRSNPANAIVEAIGIHLRITENVEGFARDIYQGDSAEKALTPAGHSLKKVYDNILIQIGKHRDALKRFQEHMLAGLKPPGGSSPTRARLGGDDYYPESPMQYPAEPHEIDEKKGRVDGNPLPSLASQWRMDHRDPPEKIQEAPINPVLKQARESMKEKLNTKIATGIHAAAKRVAKALPENEDGNANEVDRVMIAVYLKKAREYEETDGMPRVIAALEEELERLS
jgi:hypothetical protein